MKRRFACAAFLIGVAIGCSGTSKTDGGAADGATDASTSDTSALMLTITLHLENKTFDAAYFASLDSFAQTVEKHGGKLTLEPRDSAVSGSTGLFDWKKMEARGHAIGSHAAIGGTSSTTLESFTADAKARYAQLSPLVNRLEHVSGNCGNVDWVTGVVAAGFKATTASTVLCLYSIASADRPSPYQNLHCTGATDPTCHQSYPSELAQRVHPWRAATGANWLTDDRNGKLVILPGSGTLPCLEEEATAGGANIISCTLTQEDVTRGLADLDAAIALVDRSKVNTFYWIWGSWSLSDSEKPIFETFLTEVDKRVSKGQVRWSTTTEMVDTYTAWETTNR